MLEAEGSRQRSSDPFQWVYYGYGGSMYQQVSNAGTEYKHWNLRGDLAATSSPTGAYSPAPITDAFGDTIAGARQTYDWNGAWGYRNERSRVGCRRWVCAGTTQWFDSYRFTGTPQPSYSPPNESAICSRNAIRRSSSSARGQ